MSTKLDQIMEKAMTALHECNLWSPLREIRSAGSARGDRHKRPQPQDLSLPTITSTEAGC
jgi:hypothetical protein